MKPTRLVVCVAGFAAAVGSSQACVKWKPGFLEEDKDLTVKAIDQLHNRLNLGRFDEIYGNTSEAYRTSRKRHDALEAMKLTRVQFGAFREATHTAVSVIVGAPVRIRAVYNSTFEKGDATELFVFLKEAEGPRLADYQIYPGTVQPKID
jgi:hypothetical protein